MFDINDWENIKVWTEYILPVLFILTLFIYSFISRYIATCRCKKKKKEHLNTCKDAVFALRNNILTERNEVKCVKCNKTIC